MPSLKHGVLMPQPPECAAAFGAFPDSDPTIPISVTSGLSSGYVKLLESGALVSQ